MKAIVTATVALGLLASAAPTIAQTSFTGSRSNVDAAGSAAARCGSRTTANVANNPPTATSSGTSNLGTFTPTLSHCIALPPSQVGPTVFDLGEFEFAFLAGDTLTGTYSGELTPFAPGVFSIFQTHIVTGGTGLFAGASGSFDSMGTVSFLTGRPTVNQTFAGTLFLPAVPEPATWAMMIGGFALIGGKLRRRRRPEAAVVAPA